MSLSDAIRSADLPAILERHFPESGARAGQRGRVRCVWRGGEDLSGNLFVNKRGKWQLHDFVTNQTFDAYTVLTDLVGMTNSQAAAQLTGERADPAQRRERRAGLESPAPELPDLPEELLGWMWAHRQVKQPLFGEPLSAIGRRCLELLAEWIAACIAVDVKGRAPEPDKSAPPETSSALEE